MPVAQNQMNVPPSNHRKNSPCLLGILININVQNIRYLNTNIYIYVYILTNLTITLNTCETFIRLGKAGESFSTSTMRLKRKQNKALRVESGPSRLEKSCEVEKKPGPWKSMSCIFQSHPATTSSPHPHLVLPVPHGAPG